MSQGDPNRNFQVVADAVQHVVDVFQPLLHAIESMAHLLADAAQFLTDQAVLDFLQLAVDAVAAATAHHFGFPWIWHGKPMGIVGHGWSPFNESYRSM